jgi:hypothetical protein
VFDSECTTLLIGSEYMLFLNPSLCLTYTTTRCYIHLVGVDHTSDLLDLVLQSEYNFCLSLSRPLLLQSEYNFYLSPSWPLLPQSKDTFCLNLSRPYILPREREREYAFFYHFTATLSEKSVCGQLLIRSILVLLFNFEVPLKKNYQKKSCSKKK